MRSGIVLFITLSVIVSMLALVGVIFSYLDKVKQNASNSAAIIQANLFFSDTNNAVNTILKRVGNSKDKRETILSTLYAAPMTLQPDGSEVFITVECNPLNGGVNINWLGYENNRKLELQYTTAQNIFDALVDKYNINNATLLLEKITEAISGENLAEPISRLQQKKGIISLVQLQKIVRNYQFESDDVGVDEIQWGRYFSFDKDSTLIDGNYLSAELIAIFFDMELELVNEEWFEGDNLKEFITDNGGDVSLYNQKLFSPKLIERLHCEVTYSYQKEIYSFGLDYLEDKSARFEFYANK